MKKKLNNAVGIIVLVSLEAFAIFAATSAAMKADWVNLFFSTLFAAILVLLVMYRERKHNQVAATESIH